jgi:hypothetical protein
MTWNREIRSSRSREAIGDAWIGSGARILDGVCIESNAVFVADSVTNAGCLL